MSLRIEVIGVANRKEYEDFISSRDDTTFVDRWEWRDVVEKVYRLSHFWYLAKENNKVTGILALTMANHPIFGKYLATAPFGTQGGFYADSQSASQALLDKAIQLQAGLRAKYTVIRQLNNNLQLPDAWHQDNSYATYHLPLNSDPDFFLKNHLRAKGREKLYKSMKYGFKVKFAHLELLEDFWYVISHSMKELGSPYHSRWYLKTLLEIFGPSLGLSVLYSNHNEPACCRMFAHHRNKIFSIHGNILKAYRSMAAGDFFFWSFIKECYKREIEFIDMGRSLVGSGNEAWKMKWRPIRYPLSYYYALSPGIQLPDISPNNPRFQLAIKLWQRMPCWLVKLVGPRLISGIL